MTRALPKLTTEGEETSVLHATAGLCIGGGTSHHQEKGHRGNIDGFSMTKESINGLVEGKIYRKP